MCRALAHPPPRPTTWQRTSPPRSSSGRRAAGRGASGWGPPLCPSAELAWGWAPRRTWWARPPGSETSSDPQRRGREKRWEKKKQCKEQQRRGNYKRMSVHLNSSPSNHMHMWAKSRHSRLHITLAPPSGLNSTWWNKKKTVHWPILDKPFAWDISTFAISYSHFLRVESLLFCTFLTVFFYYLTTWMLSERFSL